MSVLIAICCAMVAAGGFAVAATMQHGAVRATTRQPRLSLGALARTVRTRRWLGGTALAVTATALHLSALTMAPLAVVQPVGVLSLVVTVLITGRRAGVWIPVIALCTGVTGFVAVTALSGGAKQTMISFGAAQGIVVVALTFAAVASTARGGIRCLVMAAACAVLFGSGASLVPSAATDLFGPAAPWSGVGLAAESATLIVLGGWFLHQAYAAGPPAVVIATTTVLDPATAIVIGSAIYGEETRATLGTVLAQLICAAVAVRAVLALARAIGDRGVVHPPHRGLRILIAADTFPPDVNGAANFAIRLANGLAGRGHDVHVVCPSPTGRAHTDQEGPVTVHHIRSLRTPMHPTFRICLPWHTSVAVPALFDGLRPDVVHVQAHFAVGRAVLAAGVRRSVPVIATNHFMPENLIGYGPIPRALHRPIIRMAWWDLARIYRRASVITAPTERAVRLLADSGLSRTVLPVSCGIDLARYRTAGVRVRSGALTVLFVGRLDGEKHVEDILLALATPECQDVRAEIVGTGSRGDELRGLAADLDVASRVTFRGYVGERELVDAYRRADVFCMPGTAELQSLATMEAMAAALPVIAANAMALPHLVRPGVNGYLYRPGDAGELAAALAILERDSLTWQTMGAASARLIAHHDLGATLDRFEHIYRTALATVPTGDEPVLATQSAAAS